MTFTKPSQEALSSVKANFSLRFRPIDPLDLSIINAVDSINRVGLKVVQVCMTLDCLDKIFVENNVSLPHDIKYLPLKAFKLLDGTQVEIIATDHIFYQKYLKDTIYIKALEEGAPVNFIFTPSTNEIQ